MIDDPMFPAADREVWLARVARALGGAAFDDALVSTTEDGIDLQPLYARTRSPSVLARADGSEAWRIVQRIDDPDPARANAQAIEDCENGATGLSLVFEGAPNAFGYGIACNAEALDRTLADLPLQRLHLRVDTHPNSRQSVEWLVGLLGGRRVDPSRLSLSFGIDPAAIFAGTGRLRMSIEALEASMPQSLAHFFALGVPAVLLEADGRVCHNAGATEAQEIGYLAAAAASHLRMFEEARQPLVYAAPHIGFATAIDQDQFAGIAKLRAIRLVWARILEACGIEQSPCSIHAETSFRMATRRDAEANILRNTIAVFASAVGGADTVSVLPHAIAHGLPGPHARRLARNTQIVLAEESRIGAVADPAAGSGGVEHLTEAFAERGWAEFQRIEAEGGLLRSLRDGAFQARIAEARERRRASYLEEKRVLIGSTVYVAERERPVETLDAAPGAVPDDGSVFCEALRPIRIEQQLDQPA